MIGLLLLVVVFVLARSNVSLLVGRAVPRRIHNQIAAKVDFDDDAPGREIEAASDEAERRLRERFPEIRYVFLDPTRGVPGRDHVDGGLDR